MIDFIFLNIFSPLRLQISITLSILQYILCHSYVRNPSAIFCKGEQITMNELRETSNKAYHGSMSDGDFTIKDVYDAMELGVNRYILSLDEISVDKMLDILNHIPTQTKRTEAQMRYQQFSTPP